jgi:hypothetical protein
MNLAEKPDLGPILNTNRYASDTNDVHVQIAMTFTETFGRLTSGEPARQYRPCISLCSGGLESKPLNKKGRAREGPPQLNCQLLTVNC